MSAASKPTDPRLLRAEQLIEANYYRMAARHGGWIGPLLAHIDALTEQLSEAAQREQTLRGLAERVATETWIIIDGLPDMPNTQWAAVPNATRDAWIREAEAALEATSGSVSSDNEGSA